MSTNEPCSIGTTKHSRLPDFSNVAGEDSSAASISRSCPGVTGACRRRILFNRPPAANHRSTVFRKFSRRHKARGKSSGASIKRCPRLRAHAEPSLSASAVVVARRPAAHRSRSDLR